MSVTLDPPSQLFFERPLTRSATEILTLSNNDSEVVTFKVKTTSPKQYCVRPNSGKIEPGQKVEVEILLQPFKEEPPVDFKCKDKFLVLSAAIPPEYSDFPFSQLWSILEQQNKGAIKEKKLRCVFLPPSDLPKPTINTKDDSSPIASPEPSPKFSTVREIPTIKRQPEEKKNLLPSYNSVVNSPPLNTSSSEDRELESVKADLEKSKSMIKQLEDDLDVYKNKLRASESKSNSSPQVTSNNRVAANPDLNIQILGAVALISFLIGSWLF
ncbi:VAMP-associated protein [Neoconidiobolus thromboides FSU 785]|nr:VAMP-associated protein [Neoconidiobolus thromboides FSU 785]